MTHKEISIFKDGIEMSKARLSKIDGTKKNPKFYTNYIEIMGKSKKWEIGLIKKINEFLDSKNGSAIIEAFEEAGEPRHTLYIDNGWKASGYRELKYIPNQK